VGTELVARYRCSQRGLHPRTIAYIERANEAEDRTKTEVIRDRTREDLEDLT